MVPASRADEIFVVFDQWTAGLTETPLEDFGAMLVARFSGSYTVL